LRWRGVLALNFIRRTELPPCTNVSPKHGTPAIANPLLPAALLSLSWYCPSIVAVSWCVGLVALLLFLIGFAQLQKSKCATKSVGYVVTTSDFFVFLYFDFFSSKSRNCGSGVWYVPFPFCLFSVMPVVLAAAVTSPQLIK